MPNTMTILITHVIKSNLKDTLLFPAYDVLIGFANTLHIEFINTAHALIAHECFFTTIGIHKVPLYIILITFYSLYRLYTVSVDFWSFSKILVIVINLVTFCALGRALEPQLVYAQISLMLFAFLYLWCLHNKFNCNAVIVAGISTSSLTWDPYTDLNLAFTYPIFDEVIVIGGEVIGDQFEPGVGWFAELRLPSTGFDFKLHHGRSGRVNLFDNDIINKALTEVSLEIDQARLFANITSVHHLHSAQPPFIPAELISEMHGEYGASINLPISDSSVKEVQLSLKALTEPFEIRPTVVELDIGAKFGRLTPSIKCTHYCDTGTMRVGVGISFEF